MSDPIILTHCGKLGDMLYALPIAEWFYRVHSRQVHWVLPHQFAPFRYIEALLRLQPHCAGVTLVDHKLENLDAGGQPYKFDPMQCPGIHTEDKFEYFNLGFRGYPTKFITQFYAEEHGLGWVNGYQLHVYAGMPPFYGIPSLEILRSGESAMAQFAPQATPLPPVMDLLELARRVTLAQEFHSWYCGMAVLAWFARIPQHVYRMPGHAAKELYFPDSYHPKGNQITWHEVTL